MHEIWAWVPKRLLVTDKTHAAVFSHRKEALCGAGTPKRRASAILPFIESMIDCGHCNTILSCHPQNNPLVKRHMYPRVEHKELPRGRFGMHPSCSPYNTPVKIIPSVPDYFTVQFNCTLPNPKNYPHYVSTHCGWSESVNPWW